jgi:dihydroneopterin aldolase
MRFHARVGILPHERELPQPLEMDVTVWPQPVRGETDRHALVDYRLVYDRVAAAVGRQPIGLLEDLVREVAYEMLTLDGAARVMVAARKPHVPLPGPLACAEVSIEVTRDG